MEIRKKVTRFLKYGTLFSTLCLIISVLVQIFARFFLANTPPWTEEASRTFFIYATAFGAGLAFRSDQYVFLEILYDRLSLKTRKIIDLLIPCLTLFLFGFMAIFAVQFVVIGHTEFSPSLDIRMSIVFFSQFLLASTICFYAFLQIMGAIKSRDFHD